MTITARVRPEGRMAPRARTDLQISDPVWHGPRRVRLVRDPDSGRTHELGEREHFLLCSLDGRSTHQVAEGYRTMFGRELTEAAWWGLLRQFAQRGLLVGTAQPSDGCEATASTRRSLVRGEVIHPCRRLLEVAQSAAAPLWSAGGAAAVLALSGVLVSGVLLSWGPLWSAATEGSWVVLAVVVLWSWLATVAHEVAHAVLARRYGATVTGLGLRWRFPLVYPFARIVDLQFVPGRGRRALIAVAGPLTNLLAVTPAAVLWLVGIRTGTAGAVCAGILLSGVVLFVANLVPLAPLDGYAIVSHLFGVVQLNAGSRKAWVHGRDGDGPVWPTAVARWHRVYGALAPLLTLALVAVAVAVTATAMPAQAGAWRLAAPLLVALLAVAGLTAAARLRPAH